jgi:hypothetical protein
LATCLSLLSAPTAALTMAMALASASMASAALPARRSRFLFKIAAGQDPCINKT